MRYANDDRLAVHYERHLVGDCHYRTPEVVAEVLEKLAPKPGTVVLDLGAGTGLVGKAVARRAAPVTLWALDVAEPMLRLIDAAIYVGRTCADASANLPFPARTFDGVVAAGLLEHIEEPARVFANAARVIRPGAIFVFTFPPNHDGRAGIFDSEDALVSHDPVTVRASLASVGLHVTYEETFPAYESGASGFVTHHLLAGLCRLEENPCEIC